MSAENITLSIDDVQYSYANESIWWTSLDRIVAGCVKNNEYGKFYWYRGRIKISVPDSMVGKHIKSITVRTKLSGASIVQGTIVGLSTQSRVPKESTAGGFIATGYPQIISNGSYITCPSGWTNGGNFSTSNPDIYFTITLPSVLTLQSSDTYYIYFYTNKDVTSSSFKPLSSRPSDCVAFHGKNGMSGYEVTATCVDTYAVSYDANGGTGAPSSQTKSHSVNLTLASKTPTRKGYRFRCWKNLSTGTEYDPGDVFTANTNMTLTAQWSNNYIEIVYTTGGGTQKSGNSFPMPYVHKAYYDIAYNASSGTSSGLYDVGSFWLSKNGFHLPANVAHTSSEDALKGICWTDGKGHKLNQSTPINSGQALASYFGVSIDNGNASITIYPDWIRNYATIIFDGNGATSGHATESTTIEYYVEYTGINNKISSMGLTKTGYHIEPGKEWITSFGTVVPESASGTGGSTFTYKYFGEALDSMSGKEYTLYANWVPNGLKIQYVKSEDDTQGEDAIELPLTLVAQYDTPFNGGFGIHNVYDSFKLTRDGYHVPNKKEWKSDTSGNTIDQSIVQITGQELASLLGYDLSIADYTNETVTLRANWIPNVLSLNYQIRPFEQQSSGAKYGLPKTFRFKYDDDITIHNPVSDFGLVRFGFHLKSGEEWIVSAYGKYSIVGQDELFGSSQSFSDRVGIYEKFCTTPLTNVQLSANWEINTYTVTFRSQSELFDRITGIEHGSVYKILKHKPARDGYRFIGWKDVNASRLYELGDTFVVTSNVEFIAVWKKILHVKFYAQLRSGSTLDDIVLRLMSDIEVVSGEDFRSKIPSVPESLKSIFISDEPITAQFKFRGDVVKEETVLHVRAGYSDASWASEPWFTNGSTQQEVSIPSSGVSEDTTYYLLYSECHLLAELTLPSYDGVSCWAWESEQSPDTYLPGETIRNILIGADPVFVGIADPNYSPTPVSTMYVRTAGGVVRGVPHVKIRSGDDYIYVTGSKVYIRVNGSWLPGGI